MVSAGVALTDSDYVCVLKTKQAELDCLSGIVRDAFVPLFEAPSRERAAGLVVKWGAGSDVCWVQPLNIEGLDDPSWGAEIDDIFSTLRAGSVAAVPVATLEEVPDAIAALANVIATDGRGIVLRLDAEDLAVSTPAVTSSDLVDFMTSYSVVHSDIDLVIDATLVRSSVASRISIIESALKVIPTIGAWRSLILTFSAFPDDMGNKMGRSTVGSFDRADRDAYLSLVSRGLPRDATYGDCGIGLPTYPNSDAAWSPIPNIKYTDVAEWRVHRGASKSAPSPQYVQLAKDLAAAPYYRGSGFSHGDGYIASVASGTSAGPGNATTYLRAGLSHHIEHVLDRLATHGEP
ncbi:hypothetical protein RDV89_06085 [Nocardioides zeae]|uniref:T4 beta protein n=1 Tax=Nocardioides imazamoxiresistens TaxID=3231893 RepID=A0ABU3PTS4_9ACTN|nr:hypothetical protein [Nocardioides zeae]MDT9592625.1 hypothetical protein [Nocardioides zeae]